MTEEQFEKAIEINDKLSDLENLTDELKALDVSLTYVHKTGRDGIAECNSIYGWSIEDAVKDILKKHDTQIREEIEQLTATVKKEIEKI
jgi:hypothetical protein